MVTSDAMHLQTRTVGIIADSKVTDEVRHYLTSLKEIAHAALCIRAHWNIENGLHWSLDTVFHEDDMTLSNRNAALNNQSILNKACLVLYAKMSNLIGETQRISKKRLRRCLPKGRVPRRSAEYPVCPHYPVIILDMAWRLAHQHHSYA